MANKEVKKKAGRKSEGRSNKKSSKKIIVIGKKKKKTGKVIAPKKVKAIRKKSEKVQSQKKVQRAKKVESPKKAKIAKRIKAAKGVKISGRAATPVKVKTHKQPTKVLMNKKAEERRRAALRNALIKKREEIVREAKREISKYIRGETKQLVDTALDNGDWSVVDLSEDISLRQLSTHSETLLKIDEAIRKIDDGTYGKCEDCGEDISVERLKVLPFAIYCVDCQERREQRAVLEKGESSVE